MNVIQRGKENIEKVALVLKWALPLLFVVLTVAYLVRIISYVWFSDDLPIMFSKEPLLTIGLPLAGITSLALVLALDQAPEKIKFKGLSLELEGVAGQLILWVVCFLSFVGAIKLLASA